MVLIGSVKFDVNVRKIFPLRLNAFTLLSDATKILSGMAPSAEKLAKQNTKWQKLQFRIGYRLFVFVTRRSAQLNRLNFLRWQCFEMNDWLIFFH